LKILHDFTEEPAELVKVLAAYRGQSTPDLDASNARGALDDIIALLQEEANYFMWARVSMTFAALDAVAHHLAGVPGRKNLLWVSGGFPLMFGLLPGSGDRYEWLGGDPRYSARVGPRPTGPIPPPRNAITKSGFTRARSQVGTLPTG